MPTIRDRLLAGASNEAERELIALWLEEERNCARQRAWERVALRTCRRNLQFSW